VPVISKFRHGCTCDVRQRRCSRVFVEADNVYKSANLTCKIESAGSVSLSVNICCKSHANTSVVFALKFITREMETDFVQQFTSIDD